MSTKLFYHIILTTLWLYTMSIFLSFFNLLKGEKCHPGSYSHHCGHSDYWSWWLCTHHFCCKDWEKTDLEINYWKDLCQTEVHLEIFRRLTLLAQYKLLCSSLCFLNLYNEGGDVIGHIYKKKTEVVSVSLSISHSQISLWFILEQVK